MKQLKLLNGMDWIRRDDLPPIRHIIKPWLTEGGIALFYAPAGVGKTIVGMDLALAIGDGTPCLHFEVPKARRVLYVDGEMQRQLVRERLTKAHAAQPRLRGFHNLVWLNYADVDGIPDLGSENAAGRDLIDRAILAHDAEVLVLDNKSSLMTGEENTGEALETFNKWILSIRAKGISTILMHHAGKKREGGGYDQRGSSRLVDVMDTKVQLLADTAQPMEGGGKRVPMTWTFEKWRSWNPLEDEKSFKFSSCYDHERSWLELQDPNEAKSGPKWAAAAQKLHAAGHTHRSIAETLGAQGHKKVSDSTVYRWLKGNPDPGAEG